MPKFSVKKPLTVFVAVIAVIVLGVVAYLGMTPDLLPNMNFPYIVVVTTYPGASPEKVEAEVRENLWKLTGGQAKPAAKAAERAVAVSADDFDDED